PAALRRGCSVCWSWRVVANTADPPEYVADLASHHRHRVGSAVDSGGMAPTRARPPPTGKLCVAWARKRPLDPESANPRENGGACARWSSNASARRCGDDAARIGLYGFGASAHIICQVAAHQGREVFALTRPGDSEGQRFAVSLGATWAGDTEAGPPEPLDAAIIFAPVGELVPVALRALAPGGTVVC